MKLPKFIYNSVISHNTSLGDNGAFPKREDVPFDYYVLTNRMDEVVKVIEKELGYVPTVAEAESLLSKMITRIMGMEKPIRPQLEKLCEAITTETLAIPQETVILDCELTDKIEPDRELRIMPEMESDYEFKDVNEMSKANTEILKRRMVNALVQGASYMMMMATFDSDDIEKWSDGLNELYIKAIALNDFLLFNKKEKISDENPMLGSYVETELGKPDEKAVIASQGLIYPFLLQETYRGLFELFGSHGLPDDANKARYIIKKADFTMAEAWDLRMGVALWELVEKCIGDKVEYSVYPYIFSSIVQLDTDEFNDMLMNIFSGTKKAKKWIASIVREVVHDREYQTFKNDLQQFNVDKCLIADAGEEDDNIIN